MEMGSAGRARLTIPRIRLVMHSPCVGEGLVMVWAPMSRYTHNENGYEAARYNHPVPIAVVGCTPNQYAVEYEVSQSQLEAPPCGRGE